MIIERHHDYVLRIGDLASGATTPNMLLTTDSDSPFCLRSIGGWRADRQFLNGAQMRYTNAQGSWQQSEPVNMGRFGSPSGDTGAQALLTPLKTQLTFAPSGTLTAQMTNATDNDWSNVALLFRGVKLFEAGTIWSPSYPDAYFSRPYDWPYELSFTNASEIQRNNNIALPGGPDFVIRGLTAVELATSPAPLWSNLSFIFRDHWGKPYSNDWVQADLLFSSNLASRPGLIYPEWYMQPSDQLFFDAQRADSAGAALNLSLNFSGAKIYGGNPQ